MKTLLDTCFISELNRRDGDVGVSKAYEDLRDEEIYLSVITVGEIIKGIRRLPEGRKKDELSTWLRGLDSRYQRRILPIDRDTVQVWGEIAAAAEKKGRNLPPADGLIAATAIQHGLRIYTRNMADFAATGAMVMNPWG